MTADKASLLLGGLPSALQAQVAHRIAVTLALVTALERRFAMPVLATNRVLFAHKHDRPTFDVLTCIRHGVTLATAGRRLRENDLHELKAPYAFANVKFPKGSYELIAVAEDAAGLVTESLPVTINIGVVPVDPTTGGETGVTPTTSGADTNADTNADADTGGDPSAGTGVAGTETADSAPADGGDGGCGCRSEPRGPGLALLLALGLCTRRRARQALARACAP